MRTFLRMIFWPATLTASVCLLVTITYLVSPSVLETLELKAYDHRLLIRGDRQASGQVVIVAIDDDSLRRVGRWPWSRRVMAEFAAKLDDLAPLTVGYDIGFFDPEPSPAQDELVRLAQNAGELGLLPNQKLVDYVNQRMVQTNPDIVLAMTMSRTESEHVLGYFFNMTSSTGEEAENLAAQRRSLELASTFPAEKSLDSGSGGRSLAYKGASPRANLRMLVEAAGRQAFFNIFPDQDGTIRRYPLILNYEDTHYQSLAAAMASLDNATALPAYYVSAKGLAGVEVGGRYVPTDEHGQMMVDFLGPAGTIPTIPAWKIMEGLVTREEIAGRFLLVGVTAPSVYDLRVTPFGIAYPGLEIQATALENILTNDHLLRPSWAALFDIAAVWILGSLCAVFLWRARAVFTLVGFCLIGGGFLWLNQHFFVTARYWLSVVYPMLAFILTYLGLNVYRFLFADRQKKELRSAFNKYLDPKVVEQVVSDPDRLKLGGEKCELSVLFSDIRGFTTISEKLSPEELVQLLNEYLTEMTEIVLRNRGLLDKYIGDAVMAVWGAPVHYPDHALLACRSACLMIARLEELNKGFEARNMPRLDIGVGINTGEMVAGNMGSINRLSYTVMGDNVNLGSRLEGLNKEYGTRIIVSDSTHALVREHFWTRSLDLVRVKGKREAVEIFQILGPHEEPCPLSYLEEYAAMLADYRQGRFDAGLEAVRRLREVNAADKTLALYESRLIELVAHPPEDWDGVYTFTHK